MELRALIEDYLKEARLLQIATVKDNQPWACSVYFAYDSDLNLYWISLPSRCHSMEVRANGSVAGTVVLPHTPGGPVRGLQLEGDAYELSSRVSAEIGMSSYAERYGMSKDRVDEILDGTDGHVCYKLKPRLIVLFDEVNFPEDSRQEYIL